MTYPLSPPKTSLTLCSSNAQRLARLCDVASEASLQVCPFIRPNAEFSLCSKRYGTVVVQIGTVPSLQPRHSVLVAFFDPCKYSWGRIYSHLYCSYGSWRCLPLDIEQDERVPKASQKR